VTGPGSHDRQGTQDTQARPEDLYLDLLKRVLTRYGMDEGQLPMTSWRLWTRVPPSLRRLLSRSPLQLTWRASYDPGDREEGRDWPAGADTMIGLRRLDNVEHCVRRVHADGVPGDLIETGVWRGGASIFMRAVLRALGDTERTVWVADSFQGLPKPDESRYPADAGDRHWREPTLAVPLEQVKANFAKYGLLDDQVRFLVGWFHETLPSAPIERLAVIRLDGDMYESTIVALRALYPKLSPGGYVIVDDWGAIPACRRAVEDFRREAGVTDPIQEVDWTGVFWQRAA
jgi:O-methyltransferase